MSLDRFKISAISSAEGGKPILEIPSEFNGNGNDPAGRPLRTK
jgi:hypothetical protein